MITNPTTATIKPNVAEPCASIKPISRAGSPYSTRAGAVVAGVARFPVADVVRGHVGLAARCVWTARIVGPLTLGVRCWTPNLLPGRASMSPNPTAKLVRHATLDAAAATHSRCDGSRDHRSFRDRRAAPGCDRSRDHCSFRDRSAYDADSSDTCRPEGHCQSPTVAVAWSASIEAMIA